MVCCPLAALLTESFVIDLFVGIYLLSLGAMFLLLIIDAELGSLMQSLDLLTGSFFVVDHRMHLIVGNRTPQKTDMAALGKAQRKNMVL